jgi:hypothetical protein
VPRPALTSLPTPTPCSRSTAKLPPATGRAAPGSALRLAHSGTCRRCLCLALSFAHPSSYPPSLGRVLLSLLAAILAPLRYYAGSDSCRALASPTGLSAYPALPSGHPVPNHVVRPDVALPVTSARPVGPGFAINEQARRDTPPNRVRHPTGCPFASGCSPPRLAATQLPSATYDVTSYGMDFHHADNADSRTHSLPGSTGQSSTHGRCLLDRPVEPGDDSKV